MAQVEEFLELELRDDDVLFHCDLSFPGIFHHVLYHKRPSRCYCYCHGTSLNNMDYFAGQYGMSKWNIERGLSQIYDCILIASDYHWRKLQSAGMKNLRVIGLPAPGPETMHLYPRPEFKPFDIVSACRPTPQKVNIELEKEIEKNCATIISRANFDNWEDYYKFLSDSKILLLTTSEETFGYTILDAVLNDCIPIAPNDFSYPELLPREYLYDNKEELYALLHKILYTDWYEVPELLNQDIIDNYYKSLIGILKGGNGKHELSNY